jgi:RND family efflux transporter MFP subunit
VAGHERESYKDPLPSPFIAPLVNHEDSSMRHPKNNLVMLALGSLLAGFPGGCGHKDDFATDGKDKVVVRVTSPIERQVTDYEYFTGRTDAIDRVDVRARVTGYLDKINFEAGKEVAKGHLLFEIDPRPYQAQLDRAQGQVLLAQANSKLAVANLARGKQIAKTPGAVSLEELDKLAAEASSADATVQAATANRELAELNLKFTRVTASVDGIVGRNLLTVGNLVTQDSTLLTTIVSMNPIYAYFDVDERTMLRVLELIRTGKIKADDGTKAPVQFGLANEGDAYPHEGFLDFVNNEVDASTGTIQVRGILPNPEISKGDKGITRFLLTPGLFVRVRLPIGETHKALLVPQAALGMDQGKKFVYVVNDKNIVEYRSVIPAAEQANGLQVVEPVPLMAKDGVEQKDAGLRPTDRIIVGGLQRVRSGMKVEIKSASEAVK